MVKPPFLAAVLLRKGWSLKGIRAASVPLASSFGLSCSVPLQAKVGARPSPAAATFLNKASQSCAQSPSSFVATLRFSPELRETAGSAQMEHRHENFT
jgi:hypothetical protein